MNDTKNIDVFNGDADGICALIQFRLAHPAKSTLVTGVKRDIKLLDRVSAQKGDNINVFDISMEKNSDDVNRLLNEGASILYVDHHMAGNIPTHTNLNTIIDTSPTTCTSLLIDNYLKGQFKEWAIVATFGDNLNKIAEKTAQDLSINSTQLNQLKLLGISINYNGYGSSLNDLHFKPDDLYQKMAIYASPFDFIEDTQSVYSDLQAGYDDDIEQTRNLTPEVSRSNIAVYKLPDEVWARRVSGVFGNQLANQHPERAHAIISNNPSGGYVISVRAPLNNLDHAGELCKQFPTGGGRKGAAGINQLPQNELENFIVQFNKTYTA